MDVRVTIYQASSKRYTLIFFDDMMPFGIILLRKAPFAAGAALLSIKRAMLEGLATKSETKTAR